tara:strand:+ start:371 stop:562 length:192 start_codon:yes stop_codon:yes gene_type:complete
MKLFDHVIKIDDAIFFSDSLWTTRSCEYFLLGMFLLWFLQGLKYVRLRPRVSRSKTEVQWHFR